MFVDSEMSISQTFNSSFYSLAAMTPSYVKHMEPRFEKGYTIPLLETRLHMFYIGRCHGRRDRERVYTNVDSGFSNLMVTEVSKNLLKIVDSDTICCHFLYHTDWVVQNTLCTTAGLQYQNQIISRTVIVTSSFESTKKFARLTLSQFPLWSFVANLY